MATIITRPLMRPQRVKPEKVKGRNTFYYPDTLEAEIKEWLRDNCRAHQYLFGGGEDGSYVILKRDTEAVYFKLRWHEEIEDAFDKTKNGMSTLWPGVVGYSGLNMVQPIWPSTVGTILTRQELEEWVYLEDHEEEGTDDSQ